MTALERTRALLAAFPGVTEADHHGMPSFRLGTRILATIPDEAHVRVMVTGEEIRSAVETDPGACEPFFWGKRLACVVVDVQAVEEALLAELLEAAWLRRATAALIRERDGGDRS